MSLADQKLETPKGGDTPIKRWRYWNLGFWSQCHLLIKRQTHPDQKAGTPKLRFLKSVLLADQKTETNPHQSWDLGFEVSVTCWSKGRDTLITRQRHPKVETPWSKGRDTQRWRHLDQKVEIPNFGFEVSVTCWSKVETTQQKLALRFLESMSLADQKAEIPDQKAETPWWKGGDTQT